MTVTIARRELLAALGSAAAAWPLAARAQQPPPIPVVGFLGGVSPTDTTRAFRQGLRETGYIEGENVAIEYRWAENQLDRLPALPASCSSRAMWIGCDHSAMAMAVLAAFSGAIDHRFALKMMCRA